MASQRIIENIYAYKTRFVEFIWQTYKKFQGIKDPESRDYDPAYIYRRVKLMRAQRKELGFTTEYLHNYEQKYESFKLRNIKKGEPFELYQYRKIEDVPQNRIPRPGITLVNAEYHKMNPVYATDELPESGFRPMKGIREIVKQFFPQYQIVVDTYVRPLGTTDATFDDFNKEQIDTPPIEESRKVRVLEIMKYFLNTRPYKPLHYDTTLFAKLPLNTGTDYYPRFHYGSLIHARFAHAKEYEHKPTSKGYHLNTQWFINKSFIHNFKYYGHPYRTEDKSEQTINDEMCRFYLEHPTILFTRNHISQLDKALKQRPVYAVAVPFLNMEVMMTHPLLTQARDATCCIMYGLETIRGGCHYIDSVAQKYKSFFCFDWSAFDQRLPRTITDIYYTDFLERLLVIDELYQPTIDLPQKKKEDQDNIFLRISNLLHALHEYYNNMVFITADGYAYQRTRAGVPSGLYNTQYLDSFGNLFIVIDALIEFGFSDEDIKSIVLFIMGDDNTGLTTIEYNIELLYVNFVIMSAYALLLLDPYEVLGLVVLVLPL